MTEAFDIAVIGAGPAGLAAATAAAGAGRRVVLIDSQPTAGGQVWRHDVAHGYPAPARRSIQGAMSGHGVTWLPETQVVAAESGHLLVQDPRRGYRLPYRSLVIASGARELLLPFPGWTLPGVVGAGGLQALAKQGWALRGRRVLIAGSGPLLLAAAHTARRHGAIVLGVHEQASAATIHHFARGLWRWPGKLAQAASLRLSLAGIGYYPGSVVTAALGDDALSAVEIEGPRGHERLDCDVLAVGFGLVPDLTLARHLGCATRTDHVHAQVDVNAQQRTSRDDTFAAGESCGIGGRDCARLEGTIAGLAAAGVPIPAALLHRRDHARAFTRHLDRHFILSPRVHDLARDDTVVCRCEDVPLGAIRPHANGRSAKLATRCGMGACQGRICGAALTELGHGPSTDARPPVFPTRLSTLGEPDRLPSLPVSRGIST
ncbi:MAG TPA: FAD/NAD(P)-binding oxidoreductase [Luteibacter sp.]|jgi:NADPH-dependent 2,4-dienoyl-CoA reductase/sulfur reductase-like enzyme